MPRNENVEELIENSLYVLENAGRTSHWPRLMFEVTDDHPNDECSANGSCISSVAGNMYFTQSRFVPTFDDSGLPTNFNDDAEVNVEAFFSTFELIEEVIENERAELPCS